MRRLFTLGASLAIASLALADGDDSGKIVVEVGKAPVQAEKRAPVPTAFQPVSLEQSRSLLCNLRQVENLNKLLEECVNLALEGVGRLNKEDVFVSMIDICPEDGRGPALAHVHGEEMQYASGLAKFVYGASVYHSLANSCTNMTPALQEDMMRMLRDGDNAATNRMVGYITSTESGPALGYPELCDFAKGRDYTNWYLTNLGFQDFNVNQRINVSNPSPRDLQLLGRKLPLNYENSNRVTANQVAGMMYLLDQEALVSPGASHAMKAYMFRPLEQQKLRPLAGIATGLPVGSKLVSINGYTSRNYSEVGLVTLPNGVKYVLSVMSKYNDYPTIFIPLLSRIIAFRQMTSTGSEDRNQHLYIAPLASR